MSPKSKKHDGKSPTTPSSPTMSISTAHGAQVAIAPSILDMQYEEPMLLFPEKAKKFVMYVRTLQARYPDKATYKSLHDGSAFFPIGEARTSIIKSCGLAEPTGADLIEYLVQIHSLDGVKNVSRTECKDALKKIFQPARVTYEHRYPAVRATISNAIAAAECNPLLKDVLATEAEYSSGPFPMETLVVNFCFQMLPIYAPILYREYIKARHPNTNPEFAKRIRFFRDFLKEKNMELEYMWLGAAWNCMHEGLITRRLPPLTESREGAQDVDRKPQERPRTRFPQPKKDDSSQDKEDTAPRKEPSQAPKQEKDRRQPKSGSEKLCYHCKAPGHYEAQCLKKTAKSTVGAIAAAPLPVPLAGLFDLHQCEHGLG